MKKNSFKKTILTFSFALTFAITSIANPIFALASTTDPETKIEILADEYDITVDEAENLTILFDEAVDKIPDLEVGETVNIPVSENLYLEASVSEDVSKTRATTSRTITSTLQLKNVLGSTIVTLKSVGVFSTNGTTSVPTDAYGNHTAIVWNVTNTSSKLGTSAYNAYVRNSFSGQFNIGIDPVSMTVQSFSKSNTIYCNAVGTYTSSWN